MKYYMINSDGKEVAFDIANMTETPQGLLSVKIQNDENKVETYYVKSLAGKNYLSVDKINWEKLPTLTSMKDVVNINESFKVYRGFKPSGLTNANAGTLITDMPGKIVKVMTAVGTEIKQGDTLLILEAMKMENEIKAGMDGTVKAIHVKEGQTLDSGHLMLEIEE